MTDQSACLNIISRFENIRVAVIGDLMLDHYIWGTASRISQEAPVPVVRVASESHAPGGAANVARNIRSLGGHSLIFGIVGDDDRGEILLDLLCSAGVDVAGITRTVDRPTTVKTRVLAGNQQVVRIDWEEIEDVAAATRESVCENLITRMRNGAIDAVIIEDYAKGLLSAEMVTTIVEAGLQMQIPVSLDPHASHRFNVPRLTLMTPNRKEAFSLSGIFPKPARYPVQEDETLMEVGRKLLEDWSPELLLITLGGDGMALFRTDGNVTHIPTKAREVYDVSGAGDTVMAAFMLALVSGASPELAATIANHAAGIVVAEVGTAQVTAEELKSNLESDPDLTAD